MNLPDPELRLRVLMLDNEPPLTVRRILESICVIKVSQSSTLSEAGERLANEVFDVLVIDLYFGGLGSSIAIEELRKVDAGVPIISLAREWDEDAALASLQRGAQDYLLKDGLTAELAARALRYAISLRRLQNQLTQVDRQLDEANHKLRDLLLGLTRNRQPSLERDARWILSEPVGVG